MNKEMKKFNEVVKRRKARARKVRARRQTPQRKSVITKPAIVKPVIVRVSLWQKITNWVKHFFV